MNFKLRMFKGNQKYASDVKNFLLLKNCPIVRNNFQTDQCLKEVLEDYTCGISSETSRIFSFMSSNFIKFLIPYSTIGKTILVRSLIFKSFTRVENQPLKQRLKQKRSIILKNIRNIFSFANSIRPQLINCTKTT